MGHGLDGVGISRSYTISPANIEANQANKVEQTNLENGAKVSKDDTDIKKDVGSKLLKEESPLEQSAKSFTGNHKVAKSKGQSVSAHQKFMANTAKTNAVLKQKVDELKQQQKANILKEWTLVDKPMEELSEAQRKFAEENRWGVIGSDGEEIPTDAETWDGVKNLSEEVKAEGQNKAKADENKSKTEDKANLLKDWTLVDKPKPKEASNEWQFVAVDSESGKIGSTSVKLELETEDKQLKEKTDGVDENKSAEMSVPKDKPTTEEQPKIVEGEKTDDKAKTEVGEKVEGENKTEDKAKAEGEKKAEGDKKTEEAAKPDGDIKVWFDKHPRFKLAMIILEQILDAVIGVMSGIASKLPAGVGGCITGGLSIIKGLAGFHKLDSIEKDLGKVIEDVKTGGEQIAGGIEKLISDPNPPTTDPNKGNKTTPELGLAAKIIGCVGTMCGELSGAKSWEDVLNSVGKSAADIVAANDSKAAEVTGAVKTSMGNLTKAVSRGINEIKTAVKNSDSTNDEKTAKALEMLKKTLSEDATLSEEEKNLVKALSDGAINSINAKGSKKALDAFEETLGATASAILKGRNKQIAEQTLALMKEVRAEEDPFKAALIVLNKAQAIAGFESKEVDALKKAVENAGKIVEESGKSSDSDEQIMQKVQEEISDVQKSIEGMDLSGLH